MEEKFIKKADVNTDYEQIKFKGIVVSKNENYKTVFFHGKWGSGKTTFLKKCEEYFKADDWKLTYLKVWEIKDDRSLITIAFKELHPVVYYLISFFIILSITFAILGTSTFNVGLEKNFIIFLTNHKYPLWISDLIKSLSMILGLSALFFQFTKSKSDSLYVYFFEKLSKIYQLKRVLVIDDFDRISSDKQLESYKLFNILHGKIPIIFVGDWNNITNNNKITVQYMFKFIDRKIELPVALSSFELSRLYAKKILDICVGESGVELDEFKRFLDEIFISDCYSLRDLDYFIDLLNDELNDKYGSVQVPQLIVVIYLYMFSEELYNQLINNYNIESNTTFFNENGTEKPNPKLDCIKDLLFVLYENRFPQSFSANPVSYFVNDNIKNLSDKDADKIYENLLEKSDSYLSQTNIEREFLLYLKHKRIPEEELNKVVDIIVTTIDEDNYSELNKALFNSVTTTVMLETKPIQEFKKRTIDYWEEQLSNYSVGERCKIYRKVNVFEHFYSCLNTKAKDYLELCVKEEKNIDNPSDVAYFLVEGDYRNMSEPDPNLTKLYNVMTRDEVLKFLEYIGLYRYGVIYTEMSYEGKVFSFENGIKPILEKFSDLEDLLYDNQPD